jgi:uncharacterized protein YydD (DUF2326 family)
MKTKEEIEQLANEWTNRIDESYKVLLKAVYIKAYTQCQEDMADNMIKLANYLRNNYQPLAPNQAEWQRIKDKKVLRIEDIIQELNKQD